MITSFNKNYSFLNNFYTSYIKINNRSYRSVEHAFQAHKATNKKDHEWIRLAPSASTAKKRGNQIELRKDWKRIKVNLMLILVTIKFRNPALSARLVKTFPQDLIEGNVWHDNYWGMCQCPKHRGTGQNKLGNLLMTVRTNIMKGTK